MATGVGLSIGATESVAAVVTAGPESEPVLVRRDSILHMAQDGGSTLGGTAPEGYAHSITDFATFVGSPAGIVVDDSEPYRAEDLVATALFCLINLAAEHLDGPAEFYAAYPADWPASNVDLLREALDYLGLRSVLLVPEQATVEVDAALAAARDAHAAVLATPAGATPPDAAPVENANIDTTVLPAIDSAFLGAQAYSAATPSISAELATAPVGGASAAPTTVVAAQSTPAPSRRKVALAAAAAVLLALAGASAGVALRSSSTPAESDGNDAKAATSTPAAPPPSQIVLPPPAPVPAAVQPPKPAPKRPAPVAAPPPKAAPPPPPPPPPVVTPPPPTTTPPAEEPQTPGGPGIEMPIPTMPPMYTNMPGLPYQPYSGYWRQR